LNNRIKIYNCNYFQKLLHLQGFFLQRFFKAVINIKEPEFAISAPAPGGSLISAPAPQHCFSYWLFLWPRVSWKTLKFSKRLIFCPSIRFLPFLPKSVYRNPRVPNADILEYREPQNTPLTSCCANVTVRDVTTVQKISARIALLLTPKPLRYFMHWLTHSFAMKEFFSFFSSMYESLNLVLLFSITSLLHHLQSPKD
jgi:hypothetical protein